MVEEEDEEEWDAHSPRGDDVVEWEDGGHNTGGREAVSPQDDAVEGGRTRLVAQPHYQ